MKVFVYLFLIIAAIAFVYPIFYAAGVTFMQRVQFSKYPPGILPLPNPPTLKNVRLILMIDRYGEVPVGRWYLNAFMRSAWYLVTAVGGTLVAGFVFSRMRFAGRNVAFGMLMVSSLLPPVVVMAPTFLMMARFPLVGGNDLFGVGGGGFIDKYPVLFLLGLVNIFGTFLVRMSMDAMPKDFESAALMDGANIFQIIYHVVAPAQKSILAYIAITTAIYVWNDWYTPYIYTNSTHLQTLASGLQKLALTDLGSFGVPNWPRIISLGFTLTVPCIIIFAFFQRYIVEGLTSSAIKG
jgi:multiple sugar transport system permease protein